MAGGVDPIYGAALLDVYASMLTDRQREACTLVLEEDWSLAEAADALSVSRARVSALVSDAMRRLLDLERKLQLVERQSARLKLLDELCALAERGASRDELGALAARWQRVEGVDADV